LDYFGARYYASTQGRFTSVDPGLIKLKHLLNPQKWNRYSYTLNNPLRFFDPDGMEEIEVIFRTFIPSKEIHVPTHAKGDGRRAEREELPEPKYG
jgi:RHS repeat-associated protein